MPVGPKPVSCTIWSQYTCITDRQMTDGAMTIPPFVLTQRASKIYSCLGTHVVVVITVSNCDGLVLFSDGAQLEYTSLTFSSSEYLASISGIPEFQLIIW